MDGYAKSLIVAINLAVSTDIKNCPFFLTLTFWHFSKEFHRIIYYMIQHKISSQTEALIYFHTTMAIHNQLYIFTYPSRNHRKSFLVSPIYDHEILTYLDHLMIPFIQTIFPSFIISRSVPSASFSIFLKVLSAR